jgi:hypothetical protein
MVPKWTSKYVAHRDHIRDLRSDQQGDIYVFFVLRGMCKNIGCDSVHCKDRAVEAW